MARPAGRVALVAAVAVTVQPAIPLVVMAVLLTAWVLTTLLTLTPAPARKRGR